MSVSNIISNLNRLSLQATVRQAVLYRNISASSAVQFRITPSLLAEPLKKKKRLDPAVIRAREERRKKKIEKQIRRLEKNARQLKPIDECEVSLQILDERDKRVRHLPSVSPEVLDKRAKIEKSWCQYKQQQHLADVQMLDRVSFAEQKALDELRKESEELYQQAIQPDFYFIPFSCQGPVETLPIENYDVPDGDYVDVSKKWE
ncbi:hypothetical protein NQ315_007282 [Exocentrus adspersus]|uniref:Large ribosomal subunit protein mL40 n=1 Tax=Exocentrus adspersus TaxID=1586481 RepID=A0AAV8WEJ2_9CUCU|nr:hypothetical protein NQ315_007282 [Exocentrus adspersus]